MTFLPPMDEHLVPTEGCDCARCEKDREYERQWEADCAADLTEQVERELRFTIEQQRDAA